MSAKQAVFFIGDVTFILNLIPNRTYFWIFVSLIYHGLVLPKTPKPGSGLRLLSTLQWQRPSIKLYQASNFKLFLVTLAVLPVSLIERASRHLCIAIKHALRTCTSGAGEVAQGLDALPPSTHCLLAHNSLELRFQGI